MRTAWCRWRRSRAGGSRASNSTRSRTWSLRRALLAAVLPDAGGQAGHRAAAARGHRSLRGQPGALSAEPALPVPGDHATAAQQLQDVGILISTGQISNLLTKGHEAFHTEKAAVKQAGLETARWISVDDTGARHLGMEPGTWASTA